MNLWVFFGLVLLQVDSIKEAIRYGYAVSDIFVESEDGLVPLV